MPVKARTKFRRFHLGVDYGTAWSKLVLRDMEAPDGEQEAFVLEPEQKPGDYRFPSLVTCLDKRLYFGWKAEEVRSEPGATGYASVKMRMVNDILGGFHAPAEGLPEGLDEEDLAVLTVLHLLQEGHQAAKAYAAERGQQPKVSITLGVPMTPSSYPRIQSVFTRVAWRALAALREEKASRFHEKGLHLRTARTLAKWTRTGLPEGLDPNGWVRSEAGAALHWAVSSPKVEDGLYAAVDIGAGTMSTSVFNILAAFDQRSQTWEKTAIAVFGASCGAPGMDLIDQILASSSPGANGTLLRGKEGKHSYEIECGHKFREVLEQMNENRRAAFKQAYASHPRQSSWETHRFKGIFLFGGGHKVEALRGRSRRHVWTFSRDPFPECKLEWPGDLGVGLEGDTRTSRQRQSLASDLLVAYGLSFVQASVFPVDDPGSIEPVPIGNMYRNAAWRDRDDLYAS